MEVAWIARQALRRIYRAPVRSGLTAIGSVIGVAALVTTASLGEGAKAKIQDALEKPETRIVQLIAFLPRPGGGALAELPRSERLTPDDYSAIRHRVGPRSAVSPQFFITNVQANGPGKNLSIVLEGLDVEGLVIKSHRLLKGAFFSEIDVKSAANVCLISHALAEALFRDRSAIARQISIRGSVFSVVGVVQDTSPVGNPLASREDLHAYVPYTSLLRRIDSAAQMTVLVQPAEISGIERAQAALADTMEARRRNRRAIFLTTNASDSIKAYADGSIAIARLLAIFGSLSLVVGGVGIMNVMMFSVTERTREIGTRMAIGTRRSNVLWQFLAEATIISVSGGVLGLSLGALVSWTLGCITGWPVTFSAASALSALGSCVMVGILFGLQPAFRASELRPVQALRWE